MKCRRCHNPKSKVLKCDMHYNVKIRTRVCLRCDYVFRTIEKYWEEIIPSKIKNSPERFKGGENLIKNRK